MSKRNVELYIEDILNSIEKIEKYTKHTTFEKFSIDEKTIDAVIRNLEVIGEAAKNIPKKTFAKYKDIPWKKIIGMRNKVIHEYFGVDTEILWKTVKEDLSKLKGEIQSLNQENKNK